MVISSPCLTDIKNWLVQSKRLLLASPKQTALGKDFSNPLIVDSLLKTIWLSMHHVVTMKHWLFQSKRLLVFKKLKLKKHEVSLDLSRLTTTLNRLERSIQTGINKWYRRGIIDKTLFIKKDMNDIMLVQVQQKEDGIFISQDKYVAEILKKFDFANVKSASTPIETQKPLNKDEEAADVDVHLYRSLIGSLMYLTASRPDIMYLKGKPKLGLWYHIVSSFDLEAYSDSDYAGANLDRKSTTGGCQFLGRRLIS
ncbi:hypothetical protein Tco_1206793 [Tanacetum coccineum]